MPESQPANTGTKMSTADSSTGTPNLSPSPVVPAQFIPIHTNVGGYAKKGLCKQKQILLRLTVQLADATLIFENQLQQ